MVTPERMARAFADTFGRRASGLYRAPGRVNLIGEHTDYNDGFVMPMALDRSTWVAAAPRDDGKIVARSFGQERTMTVDLNGPIPVRTGQWSDYVFGVAGVLGRDRALRGADLFVDTDVPLGAGLSSSAALEVACALAFLDVAGETMDATALARACQRAEHEFVGTLCGLMDQFIACHGRAHHALMLDTRSLACEWIPLPPGVRLIVCNTMVRHALAFDEYNARRADCETAVRVLARRLPRVRALRDVGLDDLDDAAEAVPDRVLRRCRHVVTENLRVQGAAKAMRAADFRAFGSLMSDSHRSLRDDYEVSCAELDVMVGAADGVPGVYGARMTGGGFGGCAVVLVDAVAADTASRRIQEKYEAATGVRPDVWLCAAGAGAAVVDE